jgi:hypothetical protein
MKTITVTGIYKIKKYYVEYPVNRKEVENIKRGNDFSISNLSTLIAATMMKINEKFCHNAFDNFVNFRQYYLKKVITGSAVLGKITKGGILIDGCDGKN